MDTLKAIGFLIMITTNIFAYQNSDHGLQEVAENHDQILKTNSKHSTMAVLPPVVVEVTEVKLYEDNFTFFNINSGTFTAGGEMVKLTMGHDPAKRVSGSFHAPLVQVFYREGAPESSISFIEWNRTAISQANTFEPHFIANNKAYMLSNIYDLIEWNYVQRYLEKKLSKENAQTEESKLPNLAFENLILIQNQNHSHAYLVQYLPDHELPNKQDGLSYHGKLHVKDLKGNKTKTLLLQDGQIFSSENISNATQTGLVIVKTKVITPFEEHISLQIDFSAEEI